MDGCRIIDAIPQINNLSTVASVACVLPTYFLRLSAGTYRLILSLAIAFGLSTLAFEITMERFARSPTEFLRLRPGRR